MVSRNTIRRQQGLGTPSDPEGGTSSIEKRQRSIKMKGTSTVELQMELHKVSMLCQKKVLQEILLCVDWQRYAKQFKKMYKILEFGLSFSQMSVSGERDSWKEHPSTLKLER